MFEGSIVALVTPFKNDRVDEDSLRKLVEFHAQNGTFAIVPCGTTGESATLSHDEHERVIEVVIDQARGRMPVIAGTGSNCTKEAISLTKHAAGAGAEATLQVAPYYNRPTQAGLYEHFKAIAEATSLAVILYNIPGRTGVNIEPETIARLAADCKNIVAVKEASGNLSQITNIKSLCPDNFEILSGDDALTLPVLSIGGVGVISVAANIVPHNISLMVKEFRNGNVEKAREIHYKLLPLMKALFLETNPIPLKTAMGLLGMCDSQLRLPMSKMSDENTAKLKLALKQYGLL